MPAKPQSSYSKADLARHFQCPESTIRFYCSRFSAFLPAWGEGRKRRYAPACLDVLAFIRRRLPEARSAGALELLLEREFPRVGESAPASPVKVAPPPGLWPEASIPRRFAACTPPDAAQASALHLLERRNAALERIAEALERIAPAPGAPPDAEIRAETGAEIRELRRLLDSAERTHQEDMDQLRAWIARLANAKS